MDGSDGDLGMEDEIEIEEYNNLLEFGEQGKLATLMHTKLNTEHNKVCLLACIQCRPCSLAQ